MREGAKNLMFATSSARTRLQRVKLIRKASRTPNWAYSVPKNFRKSISGFLESLRQHPPVAEEKNIKYLLQPVPPPRIYDRQRTLEYLRDEAVLSYKITARVLTELKRRSLSPKLKVINGSDDSEDLTAWESLNPKRKRAPGLRVLDFGSGVGSSAWAAAEVFNLYSDKADSEIFKGSIVAVEPMPLMSMLGKTMTFSLGNLVKWRPYLEGEDSKTSEEPISKGRKFDVIIMAFVSGEMNAKNLKDVALKLWSLLDTNGHLVVIEPGDEAGFTRAAQIRRLILSEYPPSATNKEASYVVAPCAHDGKCPLIGNIPKKGTFKKVVCSYPQRIELFDLPKGSVLRKRKMNPHSRHGNQFAVNFSYLIMGKGSSPRLSLPQLTANSMADDSTGEVTDLLLEQHSKVRGGLKLLEERKQEENFKPVHYGNDGLGDETVQPRESDDPLPEEEAGHSFEDNEFEDFEDESIQDEEEEEEDVEEEVSSGRLYELFGNRKSGVGLDRMTYSFDRMIRKPLKRSGHVIIDTCSKRGQLERRVIARSEGRDRFKQAKKSQWGDLWGWE